LIIQGDARFLPLKAESVQCCVTSPPYFGLRDYGTAEWQGGDSKCDHRDASALAERLRQKKSMIAVGEKIDGSIRTRIHDEQIGRTVQYRQSCLKCGAIRIDKQIGLEKSPEIYVQELVQVFREVWRVLKKDGAVFCNLGDSYWGGKGSNGSSKARRTAGERGYAQSGGTVMMDTRPTDGKHGTLKPKDLIGIPWRVAFALQADGWWLRQDIVWSKPNPMPESVTDRCTKSHEYLFLLSKSKKYFYDADAIKIQGTGNKWGKYSNPKYGHGSTGKMQSVKKMTKDEYIKKYKKVNKKTVWTIATKPFKGAHFAVMPEKLVEPCILAGSKPGDVILDPFAGSCTVGKVAERHGREFVGIELNWEYIGLGKRRLSHNQVKLI